MRTLYMNNNLTTTTTTTTTTTSGNGLLFLLARASLKIVLFVDFHVAIRLKSFSVDLLMQ